MIETRSINARVQAILDHFKDPNRKDLLHSPALRQVVQAYVEEEPDDAARRTADLLNVLNPELKRSWDVAGVRSRSKIDWDERHKEAVAAIRKAADLLDDPIQGADMLNLTDLLDGHTDEPALKPYVSEFPVDLGDPSKLDELCAKYDLLPSALRRVADALEELPIERVKPFRARDSVFGMLDLARDNIGARGGASNPEKAARGLLFRTLDDRIPKSVEVKRDKRYSIIATLASFVDDNVTRQLVASILKKGRT